MMCLMSQTVFETVARVEPKKNESKITKIIHLIDFKIKLMWRGKVCQFVIVVTEMGLLSMNIWCGSSSYSDERGYWGFYD